MEKITVYIPAYNEEKRIGKVIDSLKDFDAIVVLNKESTDGTLKIAESHGAKVVTIPYADRDTEEAYNMLMEAADEIGNAWILCFVCSDICHYGLYDEMSKAVNGYAKEYDCVGIPFKLYSMGMYGKHTYFGELQHKKLLIKKSSMQYTEVIHNLYVKPDAKSTNLKCKNKDVAIYHLTHENIPIIIERHMRYAKTVAKNKHESGRSKERELRSCTVQAIRHVKEYFFKGIFHKGWDGLAQFFMLMMYYSMIYLFTYFDETKTKEIEKKYTKLYEELVDEKGV